MTNLTKADTELLSRKIGLMIHDVRKMYRYTQTDIAKEAGICLSMFRYIEQGKRMPSIATLHAIAKALNCEVDISFKVKSCNT